MSGKCARRRDNGEKRRQKDYRIYPVRIAKSIFFSLCLRSTSLTSTDVWIFPQTTKTSKLEASEEKLLRNQFWKLLGCHLKMRRQLSEICLGITDRPCPQIQQCRGKLNLFLSPSYFSVMLVYNAYWTVAILPTFQPLLSVRISRNSDHTCCRICVQSTSSLSFFLSLPGILTN